MAISLLVFSGRHESYDDLCDGWVGGADRGDAFVCAARDSGLLAIPLTGGEIGLLLALFSAAVLIGSLLSARVWRRLSVRAVVLTEAFAGLLTVAYIVRPSIYVLVAAVRALRMAQVRPAGAELADALALAAGALAPDTEDRPLDDDLAAALDLLPRLAGT